MNDSRRYTARGQIITKEDGEGVFGLRVVLYDKEHLFDDQLGSTATNKEGLFAIQFREEVFPDLFEKAPDLYLAVMDCQGKTVYKSEEPVIQDASPTAKSEIVLTGAALEYHRQNMRPMPRLTGGIVDRNKLEVIDRAVASLEATSGLKGLGASNPGPAYCAAPDILYFDNLLDLSWGVIDNDPRVAPRYVDVLNTLIHRRKVRQPERMAAVQERWQSETIADAEALGALLEQKQAQLGPMPQHTLIETERIQPVLLAAVIAAGGDTVVENRYLSVLLGEIGALGQMDIVYRGACDALFTNPHGLNHFGNTLRHLGGTCGPDDGPVPWPVDPNEMLDVDQVWRLETWARTAAISRAVGSGAVRAGTYEIEAIDWADGCPGSTVVITGENFSGLFPERNRVVFTHRNNWHTVAAETVTWTDTRIEVLIPDEAGPGPINLKILDTIVTDGPVTLDVYRRGNDQGFDFEGGAPYILRFSADGRGERTFRVTPGDTVNLSWAVVPGDANVGLQVTEDGTVIETLTGLDVEGGHTVTIPEWRLSQTVCTLTADNACSGAAHELTITLNSYIDPALAVVGIEVTQAVQRFNITGDTSRNNDIRLAADKRTMVRVYVDCGRAGQVFDAGAGMPMQPDVTGELTVTDLDTGHAQTVRPANPGGTIIARPPGWMNRSDLEHSLNFDLPLRLVSGRKELRVHIECRSPYGDLYTAEGAEEVLFHEMGELSLVRILCVDNLTGNVPTVAGWNHGRQGARARYPLGHYAFPARTAPGNVTISTNEDLQTEAGWINLHNRLEDIADDYEDIGQVWCMTVPDDNTWNINGIGTLGQQGSGFLGLVCKEESAATFAHELGHTQGFNHADCGNDLGTIDTRLPSDGHYHETGIDVLAYEALPPGHGELMSYCLGPGNDYQKRWPSVEFWNIVFDLFD